VTPTAVEALTDAFRKGAITTSDIALRQQQKQKNQIDIEAAQREQDFQNDPMIQEVRKTVAIAAGAKAKSDTERAKREADLAPLLETAERARTIRAIDADRTLGESEKMAVKFQAAGVELPKTPEGFVDVAAARQSEDEINEWARSVIHDAEVAKSVKFEKRKAANGSVQVAPFSETLGRFLTDTEFTSIKSKEGQPQTFNAWRKAGRVVADAPPVAQLSPEEAAMHRANLVNSGQIAPEDGLSDSAVSELVQRRTTPKVDIFSTAAPGLAQRRTTPKVDIFSTAAPDRTIEEAPDKVVVEKPIPGEGVRELALARQAVGIGERLKQRYEDLLKSEPNLVGFLQGRVASWASTRQWNEKVAAFERDSTAILAPLAKGIFNETGVLSDKDIARYQSVIPDIRDNPKVGVQKANDLLGEVFESFANKVESWSQAGYNAGGFADLAETNRAKLKQLRSETGAAQPVPATANKPVTLSSGRKIVRGSDGKLYEVQ
jgi:hypothetical protein